MSKRRARKRSSNRLWIVGGLVAAVAVVGLLVWANQGAQTAPTDNVLSKCGQPDCGQANAPVTVEEYSDFQ